MTEPDVFSICPNDLLLGSQPMQIRFLLLPALMSVLMLPCCFAQAGIGAKFGTRDPRDCTLTQDSPSAAQLQQIFICEMEVFTPSSSFGDRLSLVSNVTTQFGRPRAYNATTDSNHTGIDPSQPVYDARGSYIWFECFVPQPGAPSTFPQPGRNCFRHVSPGTAGIAFRDTFGEWHVKLCCSPSPDAHYYAPPTEL